MKRITILFLITLTFALLCSCGKNQDAEPNPTENTSIKTETAEPDDVWEEPETQTETGSESGADHNDEEVPRDEFSYINQQGETLETRINVPAGFERVEEAPGSFGEFLRTYKMKPDQSKVLLYDGSEKGNQSAHVAVFKLPIENEDLQQCADSVMRMIGEYYYGRKEYDKIVFSLGGGFKADFSKWCRGYGISLSGNDLVWVSSAGNDTSYESFQKFMRMVFAYSGTINMSGDSYPVELGEIKAGDIFIEGGSPGHVVMVVDVCQNQEGDKAFLLAQGFMPAQEFHVLKNPLHDDDPWYYAGEVSYPFETAQYTFDEGSLKRYKEV